MNLYDERRFIEEYTYAGNDLGAKWTETTTTFKVWAPTAEKVVLALYESGTAAVNDLIRKVQMEKGESGVWSIVEHGNLNGIYYTFEVTIDGKTVEACDPYARTTGVNGNRAMILDLASTNPEGWDKDQSPAKDMKYTDVALYELHVRDFSIHKSSGVSKEHQGKFLGLTETGTKTANGESTCLDYLKNLGVTHLHILPMYDYGTVDEARLDEPQYNWGYDPTNYNVPEGSYSTDPFHGEVRVKEMKQMIKTLHENGLSVVMDVVYNHVYDADTFCFNQIVPGYFSRIDENGVYSNASICGNDTASEREMVRKYIIDSVMYWIEEYHMDGFRFDLVGLLDVDTVNEIVHTVHEKYPYIIFYGEGWDMPSNTVRDCKMAIQKNAYLTPGFAYFSDNIRDLLGGRNAETLGFVSGREGCEAEVAECFMAKTPWCPGPTQTVNYISCHDDHTFMDKLRITRPDASMEELIAMNKLAASVYILAQGIPFIHAGEELLRTKVDEQGNIVKNSYISSDYVNALRWDKLDDPVYKNVSEYYKELIKLRKENAVFRMTTAEEVEENVRCLKAEDGIVKMEICGEIEICYNAKDAAVEMRKCSGVKKS